jgi:geranylgeranyl pyrophosphate synthase
MELADFSEETRLSLYKSLQQAKGRAQREADEIIPASLDEERNSSFRRIMGDRIMLEMMHVYSFQPALHDDLVDEGQKSRW